MKKQENLTNKKNINFYICLILMCDTDSMTKMVKETTRKKSIKNQITIAKKFISFWYLYKQK